MKETKKSTDDTIEYHGPNILDSAIRSLTMAIVRRLCIVLLSIYVSRLSYYHRSRKTQTNKPIYCNGGEIPVTVLKLEDSEDPNEYLK